MFISSAMHGRSNAMAGARLYQGRGEAQQVQRQRGKQQGDEEGPAAVYERSGMQDYLERMASLRERTMKLKERIEELKEDTVMEQEKKGRLLSLLSESLASTQKQMEELEGKKAAGLLEDEAQEKKEEEEKKEKKEKKEKADKPPANSGAITEGGADLQGGAALIAAGNSAERLEFLRKAAEETGAKADAAEKELEHMTQHRAGHIPVRASMLDGPGDLLSVPVEGEPGLFVSMGKIKRYTKNCVRLDEKDAIARRQKEISALRKVTDELEDLAGELMRGEDGGPKEAETSAPEEHQEDRREALSRKASENKGRNI